MRVSPSTLRSFATGMLDALGAPDDTAEKVADSLCRADMTGYGTHGIAILPLYHQMIDAGALDPTAEPTAELAGSTARVDGHAAFGQLTGHEATATGVALAEDQGAAVVGIRDGSHLGPVGEFAEAAADAGMVLLAFTNTGGGAKNTAPFGGHERKLSTNPVAFGFPTFDALPFDIVADFATSQVSGSVIREHHRTGEQLHDEWTTTESGEPVPGTGAFMNGEGALLPLGGRVTGHKGYALSVAAELLGGLVGGEAVVGERDPTWLANGAAFVVVDPTAFVSRATIEQRVEALASHLRTDEVRLPGEGTHTRREASRENGVDVATHDLVPLAELASDLAVAVPEEVRDGLREADDVDDDVRTW
ncbi:MAG: Ldh family oxidoreductase [Halovenus sp.]